MAALALAVFCLAGSLEWMFVGNFIRGASEALITAAS